MAICFRCPSGHVLSVEDRYGGATVRCGLCGRILVAPPAASGVRRPPPASQLPILPSRPVVPPQPAAATSPVSLLPPVVPGTNAPPAGVPGKLSPPRAAEPATPRSELRVGLMMQRLGRQASGPGPARKEVGRWLARLRAPRRGKPLPMPPGVYVPGPEQFRAVCLLAAILAVAVGFSLLPVVLRGHLHVASAPGWARAALLAAAMQIVYTGWMLNAPDWATAWVVMLVCALVATGYAVVTAMVLATPIDHPLIWDLAEVRRWATLWSAAVVVVMGLATYCCGRTSARLFRGFQREMAERGLEA